MKKRYSFSLLDLCLFKLSIIFATFWLVGILVFYFPGLIFTLTRFYWICLLIAIILVSYPLYKNFSIKPKRVKK